MLSAHCTQRTPGFKGIQAVFNRFAPRDLCTRLIDLEKYRLGKLPLGKVVAWENAFEKVPNFLKFTCPLKYTLSV